MQPDTQAAGTALSVPDAIAVVIPSYKVTRHILGVIAGIG
ncbi:MAG: glycosyltransferase family 2 protein, partial [Lysobacteraceae bacterium]